MATDGTLAPQLDIVKVILIGGGDNHSIAAADNTARTIILGSHDEVSVHLDAEQFGFLDANERQKVLRRFKVAGQEPAEQTVNTRQKVGVLVFSPTKIRYLANHCSPCKTSSQRFNGTLAIEQLFTTGCRNIHRTLYRCVRCAAVRHCTRKATCIIMIRRANNLPSGKTVHRAMRNYGIVILHWHEHARVNNIAVKQQCNQITQAKTRNDVEKVVNRSTMGLRRFE